MGYEWVQVSEDSAERMSDITKVWVGNSHGRRGWVGLRKNDGTVEWVGPKFARAFLETIMEFAEDASILIGLKEQLSKRETEAAEAKQAEQEGKGGENGSSCGI